MVLPGDANVNAENPFADLMGSGGTSGGPRTSADGKNFPNIDDPDWGLIGSNATNKWETSPLDLDLDAVDTEKTCEQNCRDEATERKKRCDVVRKRVAEALKKVGCPSKVTPYSTRKKAPCKKKTSAKKKTTRRRQVTCNAVACRRS